MSHLHLFRRAAAPAARAPIPLARPFEDSRTALAALLAALLAAAVALLMSACGGGGGGSALDQPVDVDSDVVIADIDGDGRADVLTASMTMTASAFDGRVTLYRQPAAGQFTAAVTPLGQDPWTLTVGDVDGDRAPDLLVVDAGRHGSVQRLLWLRQDPAQRGRWLAPVVLLEAAWIERVALADLTGDGVPDVIAPSAAGLMLLPQTAGARGSFGAPQALALPGTATQVGAGDWDGDGRADLAVTVVTSPPGTLPPTDAVLALLRALPGGGFAPQLTLAPTHGLNTRRLALTDADGDGRVDVLRYATPCCAPPAQLTVALQTGSGQFSVTDTPLTGVQGIDDAAFADFDGDGRTDAAVTGFFPVGSPTTVHARLNLFRQGAGGAFAQTSAKELAAHPSRAAAGDVDGDGRPDLVLLDGHAAWLHLNLPAPPGTFGPPRRLP